MANSYPSKYNRHHGWYFAENGFSCRIPFFIVSVRGRSKERLKIDSSTIGMESARSYKASTTTIKRFVITEYQANLAQTGNSLNASVSDSQAEKEENAGIAQQNKKALEDWQSRYNVSASRIKLRESANDTAMEIKQMTIRYIFDLLFAARRERFYDRFEENAMSSGAGDMSSSEKTESLAGTVLPENIGEGMIAANYKVLSYTQETLHVEQEQTYFSTVGTVRTADGREISFNVEVGMSREFQEYFRENLELASFKMCDPLVINLDSNVTGLSEQKFFFDIDGDGEKDEVSQLESGSGYLALDKNGDGTINDGKELFGTASGDGFADLVAYDEDGNGWIDENDSVWSKLQIWCRDEDGKDVLYRLADKGVGAICLQKASTDFTLRGAEGRVNGQIRSTGIFLYENGNVGTIQHLDVAKYYKEA